MAPRPPAELRATVLGVGAYAPPTVMTNDDLARLVDTSDEWITTRTGIKRRHIDWEDRSTCVLIGDGAGAVVLGSSERGRGIYAGRVGADGSAGDVLKVPAGGSRMPVTAEAIERKLHRGYMDGQAVFKLAVRTIPGLIRETVAQAGWTMDQVDLIVPHQANLRIIEAMASQLHLPMEKFVVNIQEYGNTSAASVPLALFEAVQGGRIHAGDRLVLAAFGGGFTYAACALVWGT